MPRRDVELNSELRRQIRVATNCFQVPNEDDSFATFVEKVVEDFLVVSAGAYEQAANEFQRDHPVFMWPMDGETVQVYPGWAGNTDEPRYRQVIPNTSVTHVDFADDELCYIPPNPSTATPYGYGPLEIAARDISRQLGAAEFSGNVASNSQPLNLIWLGDVGKPEIDAFRIYWRNEVEGLGQTPLLGGPDEPKAVRLAGGSDDALYLKWQEFLMRNIGNAFNLNPNTFGLQRESQRQQGSAEAKDPNWMNAVVPMALTLADYFTRNTLLKKLGFSSLEFKFPGLDKQEAKKQAEILELLYQNNFIIPNEGRKILRMLPSTDPLADMFYAEVQIKIGEARRGPQAAEERPDVQHNATLRQRRSPT